MANIIKIKKGTGTPAGLLPGELAYSTDLTQLFVGHPSDGSTTAVSPEQLVFATASANDIIQLSEGTNSGSDTISITIPDLGGSDKILTLPSQLPGIDQALVTDASGNLSYAGVGVQSLQDINDVDSSPGDDTILMFDGSTWVAKTGSEVRDQLNLESTDDQSWVNLTLTGYLVVEGSSTVMNSSELVIGNKSIGLGVVGGSLVLEGLTIDANGVVDVSSSSLSAGDSIFIDGSANIPTGYYTVSPAPTLEYLSTFESQAANYTNSSGSATLTNVGASLQGIQHSSQQTIHNNNTLRIDNGEYLYDHTDTIGKFGSNPFTIEFTASIFDSSYNHLVGRWGTTVSGGWQLYTSGWNTGFRIYGTGGQTLSVGSGGPSQYHDDLKWFVIVSDGSQISVFTNGGRDSNATYDFEISDGSGLFSIAAAVDNNNGTISTNGGWTANDWRPVDNIKIVNGAALYDPSATSIAARTGPPNSSVGGGSYPDAYFTIENYSGGAVTTPFDIAVYNTSTDAQIDGSGLVFPGTDEKSIKWNDTNDHYSIIGGDLKVSGDKLYMAGTKILDNDDGGEKTINHDIKISTSQISGSIDGGEY